MENCYLWISRFNQTVKRKITHFDHNPSLAKQLIKNVHFQRYSHLNLLMISHETPYSKSYVSNLKNPLFPDLNESSYFAAVATTTKVRKRLSASGFLKPSSSRANIYAKTPLLFRSTKLQYVLIHATRLYDSVFGFQKWFDNIQWYSFEIAKKKTNRVRYFKWLYFLK